MKVFNLPDLGEGLPDAEIHQWYISVGDKIEVDQPMVAMETAKAVVDVPSPVNGIIAKLHGEAGDIIKTGAVLVEFEAADEPIREDSGTVAGNIEVGDQIIEESATGIKTQAVNPKNKRIMPAVRALAKRLQIDLNTVIGTGPNDSITVKDVQQAAEKVAQRPQASADTPTDGYEAIRGVRRSMVQSMCQSHQEVVPVTVFDDADIDAWPAGTDITLRVIRALTNACQKEPSLNAWFNGTEISRKLFDAVHIGLAMDSPEGLFVPVLKDTQTRDSAALREDINRFKTQVKDRSIPQSDLNGFTIMLSNFGTFAGRYANPIVVPPCVAILGTGKIREDCVAHLGKATIHRVLPLSLTFDHRAVTGGEATRFLGHVISDLLKAE